MQRLLADNAALGMLGMARALNGLTGVIDPRDIIPVRGRAHVHVADWMPAFVNAVRVLFAVGMISLFWIVSAWPNGVAAITFCAVIVILLPLQGDLAYSASMTFLKGTTISAAAAAVLVFAVLPSATTFPSSVSRARARAFAVRISDRSALALFVSVHRGHLQFCANAQCHKRHEP